MYDYSPVQRNVQAPQLRPPLLPRLLITTARCLGYFQSGFCGAYPFAFVSCPQPPITHSFSGCFFLTFDLKPYYSCLLVQQPHAQQFTAPVQSIEKLIIHRHECISPCRIHAGHLPTFCLYTLPRSDVRYFDDALNSPLHTSVVATLRRRPEYVNPPPSA